MSRSVRAVRAAVAVVAVVAAGCDATPGEPSPAATAQQETTAPAESPAETIAVPGTEEVFGPEDEVLTVAIRDPTSLDPLRIQDPGSVLVARQLYEGLTKWDPVEQKVVPAAARRWEVRDGGRTFVFELRPGMSFHDGSPVTAGAFRYGFERIAAKASASEIAYTLEKVIGFADVNQRNRTRRLVGMRTPNDLTLVIRLTEPYREFPIVLTHPSLVPLPRRAVERGDRFLNAPVGNGPFKIAQPWVPGQPVILEDFVGFYDTPELDGIRFLPYPDAAASWLRFAEGEIHVAEVPVDQIEAARDEFGEEGFRPLLAGYYYGFNFDSKTLRDPRLRLAVSRAIDRQQIAERIYRGTLVPARGIVPSGMPGFEENVCYRICDHSPGAARRLVAKVPRKQRSITLEFTQGEPHASVAKAIRQDLQAVGLKVGVRSFPLERFIKRLRRGKQSLYRLGWIAEYPAPDIFLAPLFGSKSPDNHSRFKSRKVDRLLAKAHRESSAGVRLQHYVQIEKIVLRQTPIVPIGSFVVHWAVQPTIEGLVFDELGGFDALEVSLAKA